MEFNANGFVHNRSKQILAMYGVYPDQIQKSNEEAQEALQKSEEQQAIVAEQVDTVANQEAAELEKSEANTALEAVHQEQEDVFNKSLADLMAPITFD